MLSVGIQLLTVVLLFAISRFIPMEWDHQRTISDQVLFGHWSSSSRLVQVLVYSYRPLWHPYTLLLRLVSVWFEILTLLFPCYLSSTHSAVSVYHRTASGWIFLVVGWFSSQQPASLLCLTHSHKCYTYYLSTTMSVSLLSMFQWLSYVMVQQPSLSHCGQDRRGLTNCAIEQMGEWE